MFSTIAVGSDGSETASKAVDAAIDLAAHYGARLVILGAHDSAAGAGVMAASAGIVLPADPQWEQQVAAEVEGHLQGLVERAAAAGVQAECSVAAGPPGDVLVELAERHGADVLVVGSRGMRRRVLGSVPNMVTHRAGCSVLVVKTD